MLTILALRVLLDAGNFFQIFQEPIIRPDRTRDHAISDFLGIGANGLQEHATKIIGGLGAGHIARVRRRLCRLDQFLAKLGIAFRMGLSHLANNLSTMNSKIGFYRGQELLRQLRAQGWSDDFLLIGLSHILVESVINLLRRYFASCG